MAAVKPPNPLALNDAKMEDVRFKEFLINWMNALRQYVLAVAPDISSSGSSETTINVVGGGGTLRVPNTPNLAAGEVAHYSGPLGLRRASRTGQLATHVAVGIDGGEVLLVASSAASPVILDGNGTGGVVYLGLNGRGTLERPTATADLSVWEQIIGVRLENRRSGVVSTALTIPASVPIRV